MPKPLPEALLDLKKWDQLSREEVLASSSSDNELEAFLA